MVVNDRDRTIIIVLWIVTLLIMILFFVYIAIEPTIIVNNYFTDGNYTFDIGENMLTAVNDRDTNVSTIMNMTG